MIPGSASPFFLGSSLAVGGGGAGYQISRSLRFNSSDSGFLSRTPAVAGNRRTWTWAGWVKRGKTSSLGDIIFAANQSYICFTGANSTGPNPDRIAFRYSTTSILVETAGVVRDFSAWFHLVVALDTTQTTSSDRVKIYVNGQLAALSSASYPSLSEQLVINDTVAHGLGRAFVSAGYDWDIFEGYLADIHFIDGQALTPSSFTEVSATTGQLIPLAYSGTFGTNGFWLKFSDNSAATAAALGNDYSGNNNDWTPNNLSVTAGTGNDSLVDTPTSYGTDTGAGGEVRGNYCTLNPLASTGTNSNGNLDGVTNPANTTHATFALPATGKWYFETVMTNSGLLNVGLAAYKPDGNIYLISNSVLYSSSGVKNVDGVTDVPYGATFASGDIIGVACNADTGSVTFYKNNVSQGAITHQVSGLFPSFGNGFSTTNYTVNFGQRAFAYTAPSGFKALCDTNLPAPLTAKPNTLMDAVLYTGTGANQTISSLGFGPDLVWIKRRDSGNSHRLFDAVRGAQKHLTSNGTDEEYTAATSLDSFNSNGFTLGANTDGQTNVNISGGSYVAWTWDAGTSTVSNTSGSITTQVRANVSAGFSIVTYTGTGTAPSTFGHGLGVTPGFIIVKTRATADNWVVYHSSLGISKALILQTTGAEVTISNYWSPVNSTVFGQTLAGAGPNNGTQVAYCFAPVVGYSSFGSYTGNGSADGPFVYTGHRSRWLMIKKSSNTGSWIIWDSARDTYNYFQYKLGANLSVAENDAGNIGYSYQETLDSCSNGFKLRSTNQFTNTSGETYVFASFAENPFQYARAR